MRGEADAFVELALRTAELHRHPDFRLGRQLARDVSLEAAQNERRHRFAQGGHALGVAPLFDRLSPEAPERELVAEQPRRQPVEEGPQLAEMVLDGRSRQTQAVLHREVLERAARLAASVLDGLRLVENGQVKARAREALFVADEDRVGRHDDVGLFDLRPARLAFGPVKDDDAEVRSEARRLPCPVAHERGRPDDERRRVQASGCLLDANVGDGLQRLAEAHLVGEHAAGAALAEPLQEGDSLALIGPKRGLQLRGSLDGRERRGEAPGALGDVSPVVPCDRAAGRAKGGVELDERARAHLGEAAAGAVLALIELGHDAQQGSQPLHRHRQAVRLADPERPGRPARVRQRFQLPVGVEAFEELEQQGQQVDAPAVDLHAELEPEPVGPLGAWLDACVPGRLALDDAEGEVVGDVDVPAERAPAGERPGREGAERVLVAVRPHDVIRRAFGRRRDGIRACELHGPQSLEHVTSGGLRGAVAVDGLEHAALGPKDACARIARAHACPAVVERQFDEGNPALPARRTKGRRCS